MECWWLKVIEIVYKFNDIPLFYVVPACGAVCTKQLSLLCCRSQSAGSNIEISWHIHHMGRWGAQ
jgi:hypothetical protein